MKLQMFSKVLRGIKILEKYAVKQNFLKQANSFKRSFLSLFPTRSETSVNIRIKYIRINDNVG
jgi:hypothetical protein